jgi:ubiquinone/menaquinone biosynthesis C-methylase UbiE
MIRPIGKYIDIKQRSNNGSFEEQYIALREKEQRLCSDAQVMQLPVINTDHPHAAEWLVRKRSSEKLIKQLRKMKRPLRILEVGCGNGWLSNKLASIPNTSVTGFDINSAELQQAKRVFKHQQNLKFVSENPFHAKHAAKPHDIIVFAASIQYFASLDAVISDALQHLAQHGQIHIIDSHFYKPEEIPAAKQRTAAHFASLGFPGMSAHYFHHTLHSLKTFNLRILYNPNTAWNKLRKKKAPFPWICIKKT